MFAVVVIALLIAVVLGPLIIGMMVGSGGWIAIGLIWFALLSIGGASR